MVRASDVVDAVGVVDARPRRGLFAVAAGAVILFAVVYGLAVRTEWGQRLDATALKGRREVRGVHAAARLLTTIDIASVALLGGAIVLVALLRFRPRLAIAAGTVIAGSIVTTEVLKRIVLPRPDFGIVDALHSTRSFPSGHTTVAMSLGVGAMLVAPSRWRALVATLAAAFASAIGAAVVATASHRPSDPIGAVLVVTAWAATVAALLVGRDDGGGRDAGGRRAGPWFAFGGLVLLVVGFIGLAATVVAIHRDRLDTVDLGGAFVAATSAIVGTILICTAALLVVLRGVELDRAPSASRPARRSE